MWKRPAWLGAALERVVPSSTTKEPGPRPASGDIYVVSSLSPGDNRLALILGVEEDFCRIALVSNEVDCATDIDVLLRPTSTGLPFSLVVEPDLIGPVWRTQLVSAICSLEPSLLEAIVTACHKSDSAAVRLERGVPAIDDSPRIAWKESELRALHILVNECLTRRVDGAVLDPIVLTARFGDQPIIVRSRVVDRLLSGEYSLLIPVEDMAAELTESFRGDIDAWTALEPIWNETSYDTHVASCEAFGDCFRTPERAASIANAAAMNAKIIFFATTDRLLLSTPPPESVKASLKFEAICDE